MSAPQEPPERVRELVGLYLRTRYEVVLPDGRVDVLCIGTPAPNDIASWIGADTGALYLSACNPYSQPLPDARNAKRMNALRVALRNAGARWLEGHGRIPGEHWTEPSLLVTGLARDALDRFARDFEQNAAVEVAQDHRVRLHLYRRDWRGAIEDNADLEWAAPA